MGWGSPIITVEITDLTGIKYWFTEALIGYNNTINLSDVHL